MSALLEKIHAPKGNLGVKCLRGSLYGISLAYGSLIHLRNKLYDTELIKAYRPSVPVISIGNIVAGGVGKTPLTLKLAEMLLQKDMPLAILSRGYKSEFETKAQSTALSLGSGPLYSSNQCGDEPYLISKRVPKALFFVGRDRVQSAKMAESQGAKIILLDDGMQHRRLHRDLDIVMLDVHDPFGKNYLLPRGFLRESKAALKRAHLLVLNHVKEPSEAQKLMGEVQKMTNAPLIMTRPEPSGIFDLRGQEMTIKPGEKVAAICALAKPEHFYNSLKEQGFKLVFKKSLKDHEKIEESDLKRWASEAKSLGAKAIVCTEKDAVKLKENLDPGLPTVQMKINLKIIYGEKILQKTLNQLLAKSAPRM